MFLFYHQSKLHRFHSVYSSRHYFFGLAKLGHIRAGGRGYGCYRRYEEKQRLCKRLLDAGIPAPAFYDGSFLCGILLSDHCNRFCAYYLQHNQLSGGPDIHSVDDNLYLSDI